MADHLQERRTNGSYSRRAYPGAGKRPGRAGFTLMEILIAVAVTGIGMSMISCLFPLAIKEHQTAVENTVGTMMCKNGLAMVKARLSYPTVPFDTTKSEWTGTSAPPVSESDLKYPWDWEGLDADEKVYTMRIWGQQISSGQNEYEIEVKAYWGDNSDEAEPVVTMVMRTAL